MYPRHVADLLKQWLTAAEHPGITRVRTLAEVGWHEQPVGVLLDLSDGWRFVLQCVGTAPDGGNANRDPKYPVPEVPAGTWEEDPAYQEARRKFEAEVRGHAGPKSRRPQAPPRALMTVALAATEKADHDGIASVTIRDDQPTLRITCTDGSMVFALAAGYLAPGETKMAHPAHAVPADWSKEPAHVS